MQEFIAKRDIADRSPYWYYFAQTGTKQPATLSMGMDLKPIIDRLKQDRQSLTVAIMALEQVALGGAKMPGRPSKALQALSMDMERPVDGQPGHTKRSPARKSPAKHDGKNSQAER
jgi:hypothetical protein